MEGHAKLSSLMGAYPEAGIVRRFGTLSLHNILLLQAELVHLEHEFHECASENQLSGDIDRKTFSKGWFTLAHYKGGNEKQWAIVLRIRAVLKEYGDALLQQKELYRLQTPNPRDLAFLQQWMKRPSTGCVYLLGRDSDLWEKPDSEDLVALGPGQRDSLFSSWIANSVIYTYHKLIGWHFRKSGTAQYDGNTVHYSQKGILRFASFVTMSLSTLLSVAAISALYTVTSMLSRLAMVAVFTVFLRYLIWTFPSLTPAQLHDLCSASKTYLEYTWWKKPPSDRCAESQPVKNRIPDSRSDTRPVTNGAESFIRLASIIPPREIQYPANMDVVNISLDTQSTLNWISNKVIQNLRLNSLVRTEFKPPEVYAFNGSQVICLGVIALRWSWYPDGTSVYGPVELYVSEQDRMDMIIGKRTIVSEGLLFSNIDIMAPLIVHKKATLSENAQQSLYTEEQRQAQIRVSRSIQSSNQQIQPSQGAYHPRHNSYVSGAGYQQPIPCGHQPLKESCSGHMHTSPNQLTNTSGQGTTPTP